MPLTFVRPGGFVATRTIIITGKLKARHLEDTFPGSIGTFFNGACNFRDAAAVPGPLGLIPQLLPATALADILTAVGVGNVLVRCTAFRPDTFDITLEVDIPAPPPAPPVPAP